MFNALLIDDESTARADLRSKLAAHPEVTILAEAATVRTAREQLARPDYDLVFLDIQLIGGSGFDLVPDVRPGARVIFVTAFDRFALRAFEINALDYLLKPVGPARLAEALRRLPAGGTAVTAPGAASPAEAAAAPATPPALRPDDTLYLRSGLKARFAAVAEISVITASDNYSEVQLADGAKIFLRKSLAAWGETLPSAQFMRVHRAHIVNLARVNRYVRDAEEHTQLYLTGASAPVPVSRDRWSELRDRLTALRPGP